MISGIISVGTLKSKTVESHETFAPLEKITLPDLSDHRLDLERR